MIRSDEHWHSIVDAFHSAAIDGYSWDLALQGLADATGSRSAQLTGIDSDTSVAFNIATNIDPAVFPMFVETAAFNPRVRVANEAPVLKVMADADFMTPDEMRRDPFYRLLPTWDIPFICLTTLERREGTFIALAAIRSQRQGHITSEQREIFTVMAPHVRAAVRAHIALERNSAAVLTGAMDALSIPVFVCDRAGGVQALSSAAEALIRSGRGMQLKAGRLRASLPATDKALENAIYAAATGHLTPRRLALQTVIVRGAEQDTPLVLDVFRLPSQQHEISFEPRALVVARGPRGADAQKGTVLEVAYGLTAAEAEVALHLAQGMTPELIAMSRDVVVGTVRTQIKTIMAKVGVSRQVELIVRLNHL
jgi:DNA-binding CsgD family transcriptional regulator